MLDLPERISSKINKLDNGCWVWTASVKNKNAGPNNAYGQVFWLGKIWLAHRLIYSLNGGILDPKMVLDHLCRNTRCVNPGHLEQVFCRENLLRGDTSFARKGFCAKGHAVTGANAWKMGRKNYDGTVAFVCKKCRSAYMNEWNRKKRLTG